MAPVEVGLDQSRNEGTEDLEDASEEVGSRPAVRELGLALLL